MLRNWRSVGKAIIITIIKNGKTGPIISTTTLVLLDISRDEVASQINLHPPFVHEEVNIHYLGIKRSKTHLINTLVPCNTLTFNLSPNNLPVGQHLKIPFHSTTNT